MERLEYILNRIGRVFKPAVIENSEDHLTFDLGEEFQILGSDAGKEHFEGVAIIVPIITQRGGWPVQIAGTIEYADYAQLHSGIAVPEHIARLAGLPYSKFQPKEDMVAYPVPRR
jgi:hypothetical protein|tara:strand:- start:682 stop:1026 length:345 start_codon:yes stop_codon:yes gene_type:complete